MFTHDKKSRMFWFSTVPCENYQEFNLVGVVSFLSDDASNKATFEFLLLTVRLLIGLYV